MSDIREHLTDDEVQVWPDAVPVTKEALAAARESHEVIWHHEALGELAKWEDEDEDDWSAITDGASGSNKARLDTLKGARFLAKKNPFVKRALQLYDVYVLGSEFEIKLSPIYDDPESVTEAEYKKDQKVSRQAARAWRQALTANRRGWSVGEFGRRIWRDGEQFTYIFDENSWPITLRFVDPETVKKEDGSDGVETDDDDVATPKRFHLWDLVKGEVAGILDADKIYHSKIDSDSTETRGSSRFESVVRYVRMLASLITNETTHRQAQSSIILIRKVSGGRTAVQGLVDNAYTSTTTYPEGELKREKIRPGGILTSTKNIDYEFVTPNSNFSDVSPLVRVLIMHVAAATGWTYSQISSDSSDNNFASSLVAESPVVQMVLSERCNLFAEIEPVYRRVIEAAISEGLIEGYKKADDLWDKFEPKGVWGKIISRDRTKDVQADNILAMNNAISPQEMARRDGVDPDAMFREIEESRKRGMGNNAAAAMNPSQDDTAQSSADNAAAGGTNQGGGNDPIEHRDRVGVDEKG